MAVPQKEDRGARRQITVCHTTQTCQIPTYKIKLSAKRERQKERWKNNGKQELGACMFDLDRSELV